MDIKEYVDRVDFWFNKYWLAWRSWQDEQPPVSWQISNLSDFIHGTDGRVITPFRNWRRYLVTFETITHNTYYATGKLDFLSPAVTYESLASGEIKLPVYKHCGKMFFKLQPSESVWPELLEPIDAEHSDNRFLPHGTPQAIRNSAVNYLLNARELMRRAGQGTFPFDESGEYTLPYRNRP